MPKREPEKRIFRQVTPLGLAKLPDCFVANLSSETCTSTKPWMEFGDSQLVGSCHVLLKVY